MKYMISNRIDAHHLVPALPADLDLPVLQYQYPGIPYPIAPAQFRPAQLTSSLHNKATSRHGPGGPRKCPAGVYPILR